MKKALVFISNNDYMAMEEAMVQRNNGYDICFLVCDRCLGICHPNPYGSTSLCRFCTYTMMRFIKPLVKNDTHFHSVRVSDLMEARFLEEANRVTFSYSTVKELKAIEYHGVEIGYGAFSTYVSISRNVMPNFTPELCDYLNQMMRSQVILTLIAEKYINEISPDLIVFHNGRFTNFKPWLCLSKQKGIDFVATETRRDPDGSMLVDNFYNDIPHSFRALKLKTEKSWENCGPEKGKQIGQSFFLNRRNAKPAGDIVYTKNQIQGKLPEGFDYNKTNIAIFNSSEDEYFSISKEFDQSVLFPNQYVGLRKIFEHYKDVNDIHFYLRIHPNLAKVPFKSHMLLYDLMYDNVTIIPPKSDISSYALMDAADKVIVFNSTMGLESSYWGKPVIALGKDYYTEYHLVYQPKNENEVYELIDNPVLSPIKDETSCYKLACFLMNYGTEPFKYYKNKVYNWHGFVYPWTKLLGSSKLYHIVESEMRLIVNKFGGSKQYKHYKKFKAIVDKF